MTQTRGLSVEEALIKQLKKYIMVSRGIIQESAPASVLEDAEEILRNFMNIMCEIEADSVSIYIAVLELAVISMNAMVTMVEAELKLQRPERNN